MKKYIILALVSFLIAACGDSKNTDTAKQEKEITEVQLSAEQIKQATIKLDTLKKRSLAYTIKVSGKIEAPPQNYISISAPMGGFLRSTTLLPGMKVNKGEVLALLEDQQYIQLQEQFLQSKAGLQQSEKEFLRIKALNQDKSASDKIFEEASADYAKQKASYAALKEKLKLIGINPEQLSDENLSRQIAITSPITGYVAKVNANVGKYLAPSDVVFELVNPEDIHLALTIFEKDIDKVQVGQKVLASTNHSDKMYPCEIILLGRNIGQDRSIDVHCHFLEYDHSLLPGMYMNAVIECGSSALNTLPDAAFVEFEGKSFVFIAKSPTNFQLQEVEKGPSENGYTAVLNATVLANKHVVVNGAYSLLMKLKNAGEEE